jgi:hypothetical protein
VVTELNNLKDRILADKDFPRQPRGLLEEVRERGIEGLLVLPWRGETAILRHDFKNDAGISMMWYFYFDGKISDDNPYGHLITGTTFI